MEILFLFIPVGGAILARIFHHHLWSWIFWLVVSLVAVFMLWCQGLLIERILFFVLIASGFGFFIPEVWRK